MQSHRSAAKKSLGFCLVFEGMPLARIFTAAMGGGDEVYSLQQIFADGAESPPLWLLGLAIVLALSVPPLYRGVTILSSHWRWVIGLGFLGHSVRDLPPGGAQPHELAAGMGPPESGRAHWIAGARERGDRLLGRPVGGHLDGALLAVRPPEAEAA